ncbi:MAG TPA: CocE/NonD family hydrolase [Longimicrobiales bacterium]|nr:CocE/NonD family hydrolase [Longimicrobiales bacterium]
MRTRQRVLVLALLACLLPTVASAQEAAFDVRANYTKTEYMVPMRDGVKLFTIVYTPKDPSQKQPILLTRTAYGIPPYGPEEYRSVIGPNNEFAKDGYIVAYQDVRGKFKSEGEFVHHKPLEKGTGKSDESTDTYDTIDWLVKNIRNNNGRVGMWGISWAGWQVAQGMIGAHPALKAASPQAPPEDQFMGDDHHSGGAFQLMYAFAWMSSNARVRGAPTDQPTARFDYGTPDGYDFFLRMGAAANAKQFFESTVPTWDDYMVHGTYDGYWQSRNVPKDLNNIRFPVLIVAGWFDAQDFWGPFRMHRAIEEKNRPNKSTLVVGPWLHGGWARMDGDSLGRIGFGSKTGVYFRESVEKPFFDFYLKDKGKPDLPEALVFETGSNQWRRYDQWPPKNVEPRSLYLRERSKLAFTPPEADGGEPFDSYVSDPWKPVPYSAEIRTIEGHLFMVEDQRFAAVRPDVLVYQTEPLKEDLTVAGPIKAVLEVATSGTDSDWVVKLIDVYPSTAPDGMGGYQMLVAGDILRGKFRNSLSKPEPMVPNEVTHLEFELGDKNHTFLAGHRLMVQVQSSWFPMFDRNPQTFVDIYHAKESDYRKATQKVYRSPTRNSRIQLTILRRDRGITEPI